MYVSMMSYERNRKRIKAALIKVGIPAITSGLVHVSVGHLVTNLLAFTSVGAELESILGVKVTECGYIDTLCYRFYVA